MLGWHQTRSKVCRLVKSYSFGRLRVKKSPLCRELTTGWVSPKRLIVALVAGMALMLSVTVMARAAPLVTRLALVAFLSRRLVRQNRPRRRD